MNKITFNTERCKGCGLCVDVCTKGIIELDLTVLNSKGYHPAHVTDMEKCISCTMCALMCPDCVIKVEKDA